MSRSLLLSLVAGLAAPCLAQVQVLQPATEAEEVIVIGEPGGYSSRALGFVYDNLSQTFGQSPARWSSVANHKHGLEDISFVPGPWATATPRIVDQISFGVRRAAGGPYDADVRFRFFPKADANFAGFLAPGDSMLNPDATPIYTLTVLLRAQGTSTSGATGNQFTTTLATPFEVPDDGMWVETSIFEPDTTTFLTTDNFRIAVASNSYNNAPGNPATVGSTMIDLGFDADLDGIFVGAPAPVGTSERRAYNIGTPGRSVGHMFRVRGDIPPPPPPEPRTNAGCIADSGYSNAGSVADAGVAWYEVCLTNGAEDGLLQFFDADSEGSAGDVSLALFNNQGQIIAFDADSGSGTNAQLSFGVGRRAAVGDGLQYDGRHGQLVGGIYYIAVAPAGSTFGDGYTVNSGPVGGSYSLNLATNVNGTPLAPTVTPVINHVDYSLIAPSGPISFPDLRPGLGVGTGLRGVLWSVFEITGDAGTGDSYFDIDFARLSTAVADAVAYIFDANGNVVAYSDDEGDAGLPMFSFGAGSGSRTYPPAISEYTGANGILPAGTYYMASALFDTADIIGFPGGERFHVRGLSGSNYTIGADLFTGGTPGGGSNCEPDFNQDGNVDQDDIACLAQVVAGDPTCSDSDPDFNGDGNVDQDDIDALSQVVAGSPCP